MNIVTALLEQLTALLEYLDLVCNFLKGGGHLPQMPHPGSAIGISGFFFTPASSHTA